MERRLLVLVGSILAVPALGVAPAVAAPTPSPSPSPAVVKFVEITGEGLDIPIQLSSERHPQREKAVRGEVEWLRDKAPVHAAPSPADFGPKYTVTLLTMGQPTDRYDVYPLAPGGPRVFRPADQPGRKAAEGWFYGRLSMPTVLLSAGVPLSGVTPEPGLGGQGGGAEASPPPDLIAMLGDWRRFMGINIAAIIIIAFGVFALAYVLRRRV